MSDDWQMTMAIFAIPTPEIKLHCPFLNGHKIQAIYLSRQFQRSVPAHMHLISADIN